MQRPAFEWSPEFWQGWRESNNPYRQYKSRRDRQLVLELLDPHDCDRVLEVGCGYGWISEALWDAARVEWTGVDSSPAMLRRVRARHYIHGVRALLANGCQLPFRDGEFDKVLCTGVLMHISETERAVSELIRVLRPGGWLLCSVNNALSPFSLPVRLRNRSKKGFIQRFQFPGSFRRFLRDRGLNLDGVVGDGIMATVPLTAGRFHFPPFCMHSAVGRIDQWVVSLFPWLAYEVWFRGVKAIPQCVS